MVGSVRRSGEFTTGGLRSSELPEAMRGRTDSHVASTPRRGVRRRRGVSRGDSAIRLGRGGPVLRALRLCNYLDTREASGPAGGVWGVPQPPALADLSGVLGLLVRGGTRRLGLRAHSVWGI